MIAGCRCSTVVKIGGGLLSQPGALQHVIGVLEEAAKEGPPLLVVPGGGPFADTVRTIDRALGISPDAAHWMAILGMDQFAHMIASLARDAHLIHSTDELAINRDTSSLPVLAPYNWLRAADPLPHSWDVTSDSIAAWVAGQTVANRLVLVKPVTHPIASLVDPYFQHVLPTGLRVASTDALGIASALHRS